MSGSPSGRQPAAQSPNNARSRAFDPKPGAELQTARLPTSAHSAPVTYMGKDVVQYALVAAGGDTAADGGLLTSDTLIAFKLGTRSAQ